MEDLRKIGIVVAVETDAVLKKYGEAMTTEEVHGFTVRTYQNERYRTIVVDAGAGEIHAAIATQLLISEYKADLIVNFGVAGALTERLRTAELCVVEKVIHYDFDTTGWLNLPQGRYPGQDSPYWQTTEALISRACRVCPTLVRVTCASADKFVDQAGVKAALQRSCKADICEMESAGVIITCSRNQVPCLVIKAISDSLTGGGREFFSELGRVSEICFGMVDEILQNM